MGVPIIAYLELAAAQCCIAMAIVSAKYLTNTIPVVLLLSLRFLFCGIIAITYTQIAGINITRDQENNPISKTDWKILFFQALCGGMFFNILMIGGLKFTSATNAGIITSTIPAAITVLSFFILKEAVSRNQIIAVILAVTGLVVLCLGKKSSTPSTSLWYVHLVGDFLVFLSIIPESMLTIIAKWFGTHVRPIVMAAIVLIINAILFLPLLALTLSLYSLAHVTWWQWALLFFYALLSFLFYRLWYNGLRSVTANTAALFTSVMPVATTILSAIFLREPITSVNMIGMVLILLSIYCGANRLKPLNKPI